jgi:acid stress-induced BolA-like protein IbaG/YrbA
VTALTPTEVEAMIARHLPGARVEVSDPRGDGHHYLARVEHPDFAGRARVAQHKMVYAALGDAMAAGGPLHALQIVTCAPPQDT